MMMSGDADAPSSSSTTTIVESKDHELEGAKTSSEDAEIDRLNRLRDDEHYQRGLDAKNLDEALAKAAMFEDRYEQAVLFTAQAAREDKDRNEHNLRLAIHCKEQNIELLYNHAIAYRLADAALIAELRNTVASKDETISELRQMLSTNLAYYSNDINAKEQILDALRHIISLHAALDASV